METISFRVHVSFQGCMITYTFPRLDPYKIFFHRIWHPKSFFSPTEESLGKILQVLLSTKKSDKPKDADILTRTNLPHIDGRPDSLSFICKVLPDAWGKWSNYEERIFFSEMGDATRCQSNDINADRILIAGPNA